MRNATLKLVLSVIAVSAVTMLGAGPAAANGGCIAPSVIFYLHFNPTPPPPPPQNPPNPLVLVTTPPAGSVAKFLDSPALKRTGTYPYPYTLIGEWDDGYVGNIVGCILEAVSPLHVWLGLRNSDDQGTNFDLKADVLFTSNAPGSPTVIVASTEKLCIKGLTRNPALAQEIISGFPPPLHVAGDGEFSLTLSARIASPACGGHANATGLRVYYDSADRDSRFDVEFAGGG